MRTMNDKGIPAVIRNKYFFMANKPEITFVFIVSIFTDFRPRANRCSAFRNKCVEGKTTEFVWNAEASVLNAETVFLHAWARAPDSACRGSSGDPAGGNPGPFLRNSWRCGVLVPTV